MSFIVQGPSAKRESQLLRELMPESNSYELRRRPTSAQISSMKDATMLLGMPPNIDMRRPGRKEFHRYYDEWNVAEAWRDVRQYWA